MPQAAERLSPGRLVVGLVLISIGLVAVLDGSGAVSWGRVVGDWWPAALILLGVAHAWTDRRMSWGPGILMLAGGALLLATTGVFGGRGVAIALPLLLIALGIGVIVGWGLRRTVVRDTSVNRVVVASAPRFDVRSESLSRIDLTVIAGSARIDLSRATLAPGGAKVSATVVGGSVEVIVPEGWRVIVRGVAVFGGWDDTTSRRVGDDAPQLEVRALAVLGGVDVRHRRRWG